MDIILSELFYLIRNSSGMFLLNKTRPGDAHLGGYRTVNSSLEFELRSHSSAKELQATLCSMCICNVIYLITT